VSPVSTIADFAAVGAVLGGLAALVLGHEDRVEKWTAKGAVYGGAAGISATLSAALGG